MNKRKVFIDRFIHRELKDSPYELRKARVLTYIHLYLIITVVCLYLATFFLSHKHELPILVGGILILVSIYIFKRCGNFIISGNLIASLWPAVLIPQVFITGGIFSDNILWLLAAPLMALLFANRVSGLIWTIALCIFIFYVYYLDTLNLVDYRAYTYGNTNDYYLVSYLAFITVIFGIVYIFAKGKEDIINLLKEKQQLLVDQKREISLYAKQLESIELKLRESNKELEQFAYAASHDLKEPLRMISSYIQLLERKVDYASEKSTAEYFYYITDGAKRMQNMLDDLLEYSRVGRKGENYQDTDLNEILFVVLNNLMVRMKETDTVIYATDLPVIFSSSTEMIQLLQNLLSNAIKFTKREKKPVIRINAKEDEDSYVISVSDNGIGIAEDQKDRVFGIFERLNHRSEYEGSGIGLTTCRKIVKNVGGDIWLDSKVDEGTTFHISIPKKVKQPEPVLI